jgi:hypothetical protein
MVKTALSLAHSLIIAAGVDANIGADSVVEAVFQAS